jgi:hypothetical protein
LFVPKTPNQNKNVVATETNFEKIFLENYAYFSPFCTLATSLFHSKDKENKGKMMTNGRIKSHA